MSSALQQRSFGALAIFALACSGRSYRIADACPGAGTLGPVSSCGSAGSSSGADAGLSADGFTFALDLRSSGGSQLAPTLTVAGASLPALLDLRGEHATENAWPAEGAAGSLKTAQAPASVGLAAPFTDGTRAVALGKAGPTFESVDTALGDPSGDDFALEVVLRTQPGALIAQKSDGKSGWSLRSGDDGALSLELARAGASATIGSEPLIANAWYHCLFWVSRAAGGRADCDGRPGTSVELSALGSLAADVPLTLGGSAACALALLRVFSLKNAPALAATDLTTASRTRFAELTGVLPRIAAGTALPAVGLRNSPAYLDLERDGVRELFLVGPDWPRIACRVDLASERQCGYLSEPERTRFVPADARAWTAGELTVSVTSVPFAESQSLFGLTPSASNAPHVLSFSGAFGGARQALSFFAHAEGSHLMAVSAGSVGPAVFNLATGRVISAPPSVGATIEAFGNGLFRCSYVFAPDPGALAYELTLLADDGTTVFAGDSSQLALELAGLQLDVGQADAGELLAADLESADALTFVGDDGNLPSGAVSAALQMLVPAGPRLNDEAALSLNSNGDFGSQVELYVTGDAGELKFWGLEGGNTYWAFNHPASFVDGKWHAVVASWDESSASLTVDGVAASQNALLPNQPQFSLNRIDVGFSASSSGSLGGLVGGLEVGAGTP